MPSASLNGDKSAKGLLLNLYNSFVLSLLIQPVGMIHSIPYVSNEFLNFFLIG